MISNARLGARRLLMALKHLELVERENEHYRNSELGSFCTSKSPVKVAALAGGGDPFYHMFEFLSSASWTSREARVSRLGFGIFAGPYPHGADIDDAQPDVATSFRESVSWQLEAWRDQFRLRCVKSVLPWHHPRLAAAGPVCTHLGRRDVSDEQRDDV